jgi:hypothetical protein
LARPEPDRARCGLQVIGMMMTVNPVKDRQSIGSILLLSMI